MLLQNVAMFEGLSTVEQARLFGSMEKITVEAGTVIFNIGDSGDAMYIINRGEVELFASTEEGERHLLTILKEGEVFGEMALLTGNPRSASAIAASTVDLFKMGTDTFHQLILENNTISTYLSRLLCQRLAQTNSSLQRSKDSQVKQVLEELSTLPELLQNTILMLSLLPGASPSFLTHYFKQDAAVQQIYQYKSVYKELLVHEYEAGVEWFYVDPAVRLVLRDMYASRFGSSQKEGVLDAAVAYFLAQQQFRYAVQTYIQNEEWEKACAVVEGEVDWDALSVEEKDASGLLFAACPKDVLFCHEAVLFLLLEAQTRHNLAAGFSLVEDALENIHLYFSDQQATRLYEYAAAFSKKLGYPQKALEYLNMAYSLASELTESSSRRQKADPEEGQDREYALSKLNFDNMWRLARAEKASHLFNKNGLSILFTILFSCLCLGYFSQAEPFPGLSHKGMLFVGLSLTAMAFWIVNVIPDYIVALLLAMSWSLTGLVEMDTVLSGFSSPVWLYMMGILALGAAISHSGLLYRLSLHMLKLFPKSYRGQMVGLMISGIVFNPLLPSSSAKVVLASPIALSISEAMGFSNRSKGSAGLGLTAMVSYGYLSPFFLTASSLNVLAMGLISKLSVSWGQWFWYALPAFLVFTVGMFVANLFLFRPGSAGKAMSAAMLDEQLTILGSLTKEEKITLWTMTGTIGMLMLESWHHIASVWIMLTGFSVLVITGVLDSRTLKSGIDWPFMLFNGVALAFATVASKLGVVKWLTGLFAHFLEPFTGSPYLFIPAVAVTVFLVTFIVRDDPAVILLVISLAPLCDQVGIHPWLLLFVILLTSDPFFFTYQSPTYLLAYYSTEERAFSHRQGQKVAICYALFAMLAVIVSIPFWQWIGLIR